MPNPSEHNMPTYKDWLNWDGSWELINGKAYNMSPAPSSLHQYIVGELHYAFRTFFKNQNCFVFVSPFGVFLSEKEDYDSPDHVLQPDISVVCTKERVAGNGCHEAPTLIVEVLSPTTALKDFNEKFNLYEKFGVQEYWIIDPGNRTVHLYTLVDGRYSDKIYTNDDCPQSVVFADLAVPAGPLFDMGI
jgi:Uma2 family endonuclease